VGTFSRRSRGAAVELPRFRGALRTSRLRYNPLRPKCYAVVGQYSNTAGCRRHGRAWSQRLRDQGVSFLGLGSFVLAARLHSSRQSRAPGYELTVNRPRCDLRHTLRRRRTIFGTWCGRSDRRPSQRLVLLNVSSYIQQSHRRYLVLAVALRYLRKSPPPSGPDARPRHQGGPTQEIRGHDVRPRGPHPTTRAAGGAAAHLADRAGLCFGFHWTSSTLHQKRPGLDTPRQGSTSCGQPARP